MSPHRRTTVPNFYRLFQTQDRNLNWKRLQYISLETDMSKAEKLQGMPKQLRESQDTWPSQGAPKDPGKPCVNREKYTFGSC